MIETLLKTLIVIGGLQLTVAALIYAERKVAALLQDRIGPNRVGPAGILQSFADGLKILFKEEVVPGHVNKALFILAPAIAVALPTIGFAVVPFGDVLLPGAANPIHLVIAPGVDIGILFILAAGSLTVYAVILGGWASNNKYSFLGGLRASAQLISYEIPLSLAVLSVVLVAGSLNLEHILAAQADHVWFVFYQPVACLLFLISGLAETNRLPFDLPEAEQELVGGYHTEYSGMKFLMFFLGEYTQVITFSLLTVILFFGGWDLPWLIPAANPAGAFGILVALAKVLVLGLKLSLVIFFVMWVRWTLPRFRFDQLMAVAWKGFMPLGLANLLVTAVVLHLRWSPWAILPLSLLICGGLLLLASRPAGDRQRLRAAV